MESPSGEAVTVTFDRNHIHQPILGYDANAKAELSLEVKLKNTHEKGQRGCFS